MVKGVIVRTKEEIKKDIDSQKRKIALEESFNKDSGNLSFLYWQLHELERELNEEYSNKKV